MNALSRSITAVRSINYEPVRPAFFMPDHQAVNTRFWSDGEFTNIYYRGETFSMRAHWLIAWAVFRIVRKFWKNRSIPCGK